MFWEVLCVFIKKLKLIYPAKSGLQRSIYHIKIYPLDWNLTFKTKMAQCGLRTNIVAHPSAKQMQKYNCSYTYMGESSYFCVKLLILQSLFSIFCKYSARRLMESRILESAAYCIQILLARLHIDSAQSTLVNWIIRLLLSLLCWPKVILLSGGHCIDLKLVHCSY